MFNVELKDIVMPTRQKKQGRLKGAEKTAIGLPKRK